MHADTSTFDFAGQRVTVMGLGRHGGGSGVVRWLAERGADVLVTDLGTEEDLTGPLESLRRDLGTVDFACRLGEHNVSDFTDTDLVIVNPAVPKPWDNRFLRSAQAAGVPITTEISLVVDRLPERSRVIGVTGSAGKSTTASMIAAGLETAGVPALLGGNIGGSLLEALPRIREGRPAVVLELSSAMLHWLGGWSPGIAVVTSFAPNHLDWHGDLSHYEHSKRLILAHQKPGNAAVLGPGLSWPIASGVRLQPPGDPIDALRVPGAHNRQNAALALAACRALDDSIDVDAATRGIRAFPGLAHRLRDLGVFGGIRCIDDSKSTTPESAALACRACAELLNGEGRLLLIAGGYDKQVSLDSFGDLPGSPEILAIGQTAEAIRAASAGRVRVCGTLEHAIDEAASLAKPGDLLLLSPGCASWDQFTSFEQRGERFGQLVAQRLGSHKAIGETI